MLTEDSEQMYRQHPSLQKAENNILLLLTWISTYHGQTLEVLRDWIRSEESLHLYRRLIEELRLRQTLEEFALIIAALLCRERLFPCSINDTIQPVGGCYLADFDAILNGQDISNRRTVFEQMILSLLRVPYTLEDDSENILQLLAYVLDKGATFLAPLDGVSDQYCAKKIRGYTHYQAFEEVKDELLKSIEAMLKRETNADAEWMMIFPDHL